jgi:hypothetical protein
MIAEAGIISQPYSGEYNERIYDIQSARKSQDWTYIRFTNEDHSEWCGHFRGFPKEVAVSKVYNIILILTSDCLYQLDKEAGDLQETEVESRYENLTVAPNGHFVLADYSGLEKVTGSIKSKEQVEGPIRMDRIEFKKWHNGKLEFTCYELSNYTLLTMTYDGETGKIEIKND